MRRVPDAGIDDEVAREGPERERDGVVGRVEELGGAVDDARVAPARRGADVAALAGDGGVGPARVGPAGLVQLWGVVLVLGCFVSRAGNIRRTGARHSPSGRRRRVSGSPGCPG